MKKLCVLSLLIMSSLSAMEERMSVFKIKQASIQAPERFGKIKLFHDESGFHIKQNGEIHDVNQFDVDPLLRNANKKTLKKFQKVGYIGVKQFDNGEFSLKAHVRGLGGGPGTAAAFYWIAKTLCYGTAAAAVTASVAAATPVAVAGGLAIAGSVGATATGAAIGAAGTAVGTAIATTTAGAVAATVGAGAVVGGLTATATGVAAATAVTGSAMVASGGCFATMIGMVETISLGAAALGMMLPLP